MDTAAYPFMEHLKALRKVITRSLIGVGVALGISITVSDKLLNWLLKPIRETQAELSVLTPHEYFFTEMKAALVGGLLLSTPWIFYQIWLFLAPGLYKHEKKLAFSFVFSTALCFIGGVLFAQYYVLPSIFDFFLGTLPAHVKSQYSVGLLFTFSTNLLLAFGLVFETPVLVFLLVFFDLMELKTLQKSRPYLIVLAFVVGAVLTPTPDPFTQTMMALPIVLLYELGLFLARLVKLR